MDLRADVRNYTQIKETINTIAKDFGSIDGW
jgi:hypothetical protein